MTVSSILQIPHGAQCFYGEAAGLRRAIEHRVGEVFAGWSYEEILLPLFDHYDVFARGGGLTSSERIFRFIGRQGEVLALRPDFTALVAKIVASRMQDRPGPIRLFYSGEVLRYQPPQAGRQEDLFQIGLEHIGRGLYADLEILLIALEALDAVGVADAVLTVGHAGFVQGILDSLDVADDERRALLEALRGRDRLRLRQILKREPPAALIQIMELFGGAEVLEPARRMADRPGSREALDCLEALSAEFQAIGVGGKLQFDLGEVLGFEYYTGLVFEIHAPGLGQALGGGGRYDSLIGKFGADRPAVGFSLSLDRLARVVSTREPDWTRRQSPLRVAKQKKPAAALQEALELRRQGRRIRIE